ncbi:TPA: VWA domain-containing protein, partial [Candidatus Bipolaricaulota bacterium]|nr:VWA domain-containing protein [Candidatus Bipolaricaulota bacterium]
MNGREISPFLPIPRFSVLVLLLLSLLVISTAAQAQGQEQEVDLVVIVDESGSLCQNDGIAKEVNGLIRAFNEVVVPAVEAGAKIRMAVVSFSFRSRTRIGLVDVATHRTEIIAALNAIKRDPACSSTSISKALNRAAAILAQGRAPRKVINLVTDGRPQYPAVAQRTCTAVKEAGIELWTLGIGEGGPFLEGCAGPPPARNFQVRTIDDFAEAEKEKLGRVIRRAPRGVVDCITARYKDHLIDEAQDIKEDLFSLGGRIRERLEGEKLTDAEFEATLGDRAQTDLSAFPDFWRMTFVAGKVGATPTVGDLIDALSEDCPKVISDPTSPEEDKLICQWWYQRKTKMLCVKYWIIKAWKEL